MCQARFRWSRACWNPPGPLRRGNFGLVAGSPEPPTGPARRTPVRARHRRSGGRPGLAPGTAVHVCALGTQSITESPIASGWSCSVPDWHRAPPGLEVPGSQGSDLGECVLQESWCADAHRVAEALSCRMSRCQQQGGQGAFTGPPARGVLAEPVADPAARRGEGDPQRMTARSKGGAPGQPHGRRAGRPPHRRAQSPAPAQAP
jgi:hypothetical protein